MTRTAIDENEASHYSSQWKNKDGWLAVLVCLIFAEAVLAGNDRSCMPSFSLNILTGQMILFNMLGLPEIMTLVAGIPAFFFAASPVPSDVLRRPIVWGVGIAAISACIGLLSPHGGFGIIGTLLLIIAIGVVIGLCVRAFRRHRLWVVPLAVVLACSVAAVIFSFGHYGANNCWP